MICRRSSLIALVSDGHQIRPTLAPRRAALASAVPLEIGISDEDILAWERPSVGLSCRSFREKKRAAKPEAGTNVSILERPKNVGFSAYFRMFSIVSTCRRRVFGAR